MTTLTVGDFDADEQEAITLRLQFYASDIAFYTQTIAEQADKFNKVAYLDSAAQKVQDANVAAVLTILHAIVTQRDIDQPTEAPHTIKFEPPDEDDPSFPVILPDLTAADDLPTYLAAVPGYATPFSTATLTNGDLSIPNGGWELWHFNPGGGPPAMERDPVQPTVGELTVGYPPNLVEFDDRDEERLNDEIGSYVLKSLIVSQVGVNTNLLALYTQRKEFWESVGFTGG